MPDVHIFNLNGLPFAFSNERIPKPVEEKIFFFYLALPDDAYIYIPVHYLYFKHLNKDFWHFHMRGISTWRIPNTNVLVALNSMFNARRRSKVLNAI